MSLYKEKDLKLFSENIDKIQDEVKKKTWNLLEPSGDTKLAIVSKVLEYVKSHKRKIYGSYAHNKTVILKNKKDNFISDLEIPDIDFYSPEPLVDLYNICNMFNKLGYTDVMGQDAQHAETYKIFVNEAEACDISYVPRNIYNKIPFVESEGLIYVHPHWALIDYYRVMCDPMTSWEIKLDKRFKRMYLLQKNYPFQIINKPLDVNQEKTKEVTAATNKIFRFIIDKPSIIVGGIYAYNYYLHESGIKKQKDYNYTDISYYELISSNYLEDAKNLVSILCKSTPNPDFTYVEHYPFFQYTDFSTRLYYKKNLICVIYGNNKKCYPSHPVESIYFEKNTFEKNTGIINIVSFSTLILFSLINYFYYRLNEDSKNKDLSLRIISHLAKMRNYYMDANNKNIFNAGIFSDFIINCIGKTVSFKKEQIERMKVNIANNRAPMFRYKPGSRLEESPPSYLQFKNSSGNKINNEKNFKLKKDAFCAISIKNNTDTNTNTNTNSTGADPNTYNMNDNPNSNAHDPVGTMNTMTTMGIDMDYDF